MRESIVSDATTIITLVGIGRMDILTNIFDRVYLPQSVYEEILAGDDIEIDMDFFLIKQVKDQKLLKVLSASLDIGESEAIALAVEMGLGLIIDEKKGRKVALGLNLDIFGLIGLIVLNHKKGFITIDDALDVFLAAKNRDFRVSAQLENMLMELLGATK